MEFVDVPKPARSGSLWTDEDYQMAVERVKAGADVDQVAEALHRSPDAVANKLRKLLPPEQRKCPPDRTVHALATAIADPDYDWREVVLKSPAAVPVTEIVRAGLPGVDSADLVATTYALATTRTRGPDALLNRALEEVGTRHLDYSLMQTRANVLLQQDSPVTRHEAMECARDWLESLREGRSPYFDDGPRLRRVGW